MTELTDIQQKIRTSLIAAIQQDNPQEVQTIFNNKEYDDIQGMRILRDPYTNKPYVRFFVTKRVGGEVVNTSAIKLLKIASKY